MEFTEKEISLLISLLATPVQIAPAQMVDYLALVQSIQSKLNKKDETIEG